MANFDINPNQKKIYIKKEKCDSDNKYTTINLNALENAMVSLSNAEFKIWMYLAKNKPNYLLDLSPAAARQWGISRSTMQLTIRKFEEIGYLEKISDTDNIYNFYEIPQK